jgi:dTDP-4-amino-4,6-dideoxygalactose transaminase
MGLTSLQSMNEIIHTNYRNYKEYEQELNNVPGVSLLKYNDNEKLNYQYIVLEIDENQAGISRDQLLTILHSENIFARRYFYPGIHRMEPYNSYFPHSSLLLPETERLTQRIMVLPTGTSISLNDIKVISQIIKISVEYSDEIKSKMGWD